MSEPKVRPKRVAEAIRAHLSRALVRDLGDPRLSQIVLTDVSVSDDLGVAWVTFRRLDDDADVSGQRRSVKVLERASGKLRRGLAPALPIKRVPELRFRYDAAPDAGRRIEELLREIAAEPKADE